MGVHHAFRTACGTGGVNAVGQAVGIADIQVVRRMPGDLGLFGIEPEGRHRVFRQALAHVLLGDEYVRFRVFEHVRQAFDRVAGIQGDVGASRLEDGQERNNHLRAALDAQGNPRVGFDAMAVQVTGQLVGLGIELRITQWLLLEDQRDGLGSALNLLLEQSVQRLPGGKSRSVSFHGWSAVGARRLAAGAGS